MEEPEVEKEMKHLHKVSIWICSLAPVGYLYLEAFSCLGNKMQKLHPEPSCLFVFVGVLSSKTISLPYVSFACKRSKATTENSHVCEASKSQLRQWPHVGNLPGSGPNSNQLELGFSLESCSPFKSKKTPSSNSAFLYRFTSLIARNVGVYHCPHWWIAKNWPAMMASGSKRSKGFRDQKGMSRNSTHAHISGISSNPAS